MPRAPGQRKGALKKPLRPRALARHQPWKALRVVTDKEQWDSLIQQVQGLANTPAHCITIDEYAERAVEMVRAGRTEPEPCPPVHIPPTEVALRETVILLECLRSYGGLQVPTVEKDDDSSSVHVVWERPRRPLQVSCAHLGLKTMWLVRVGSKLLEYESYKPHEVARELVYSHHLRVQMK